MNKLQAHQRESVVPAGPPVAPVAVPERCSPARVRCAALKRALACCAPFWSLRNRDGRLRREHIRRRSLHENNGLLAPDQFAELDVHNCKRVQRLMRRMGIEAHYPKPT